MPAGKAASQTERFNEAIADAAVEFIEHELSFPSGDRMGQPFELLDWQREIVRDIFGWQAYNEEFGEWVRRYKTAYIEIPRKNGKSAFLSAVMCLHLAGDPSVRGTDIVCVAVDRDQAAIVFDGAATMIEANPELEKRCYVARRSHKRIENYKNGNKLYVIPGDALGALGLFPGVISFDELLAQKKRDLFDAVTTGQGAAKQPLLWMITTAGEYGSLAYEQKTYGEAVAAGGIDDPSFYYVRFGMEEGEDWTDRDMWRRVNPSLGKTVTMSYLESEFVKAEQSLPKQLAFRKFYLSEWNLSESAWLDPAAWEKCAVAEPHHEAPAYLGIDLSSRKDTTAVGALSLGDDGVYTLTSRIFLPGDGIEERSRDDGVPYIAWARDGWITLTDGPTIDYSRVWAEVERLQAEPGIADVGYDQWNAGDIEARLLAGGIESHDVQQGYYLSEALKEFETLVLDGRLRHDGSPVMRWMISNVVVKVNEQERVKVVKKGDRYRIDGVLAAVMALDRAMRHEPKRPVEAVVHKEGNATRIRLK